MNISIVTATYNASQQIPRLVSSLRSQTNKNFEWIIADGGSTDSTLDIIREIDDLNIIVDSKKDFGVYDALNRAIQIASSKYYVVMGADDYFYKDAIHKYLFYCSNFDYDIVSSKVRYKSSILSATRRFKWFYGQNYYVSVHSVGCMVRKALHEDFGYYSRYFPIGADYLFIKSVGDANCNIYNAPFIAGEFGSGGVSNFDYLGSLTDIYRAQIQTGENKLVQTALLLMRICKNFRRI